MSDFNYLATAKRVTSREVAVARLERDYSALVGHFGLTAESDSKVITAAARQVVIDGAPDVALTDSDLSGRDPGADSKVRLYWQAARAVRIGLVTAIGASASTKDTDWLRLVKQAAENAHNKGEFSVDAIVAAVQETLNSDES